MPHIHNNQRFIDRRRELRQAATKEETILWQFVRGKKLGATFLRQHSIGPYIVDFYCAKHKLIIELDGNQHLNAKEYDQERTYYLESLGFRVIRFWNSEIQTNLESCLSRICSLLN
jgi:very-short-patch-repair endonuclease